MSNTDPKYWEALNYRPETAEKLAYIASIKEQSDREVLRTFINELGVF